MTMNTNPRIAAVMYDDGAALNQLFLEVVDELRHQEKRLCGVVQHAKQDKALGKSACCGDLALEDLSLGVGISVSQNLGEGASDCHLDSHTLSQVAMTLTNQLSEPDANIDLLIINRFGQSESEGHGMFNVFTEAVMQGIPVLTAVKSDHQEAWEQWHGGIAQNLSHDRSEILNWCSTGFTN